MIEILDEKVICTHGSFKRVLRYLRGAHPERGKLIRGLTGWETVEEVDVIKPMIIFTVEDGAK